MCLPMRHHYKLQRSYLTGIIIDDKPEEKPHRDPMLN